jgi:hypothetical protein
MLLEYFTERPIRQVPRRGRRGAVSFLLAGRLTAALLFAAPPPFSTQSGACYSPSE